MTRRGEVYRLRAPAGPTGHEVRGLRYAVVVQSSDVELSTVIVAPTSTSALDSWLRPKAVVRGRRMHVMVEQLRAVDRRRLGRSAGVLTSDEMADVDRALELVLGLAPGGRCHR
jgi:mRNA interferase MazF